MATVGKGERCISINAVTCPIRILSGRCSISEGIRFLKDAATYSVMSVLLRGSKVTNVRICAPNAERALGITCGKTMYKILEAKSVELLKLKVRQDMAKGWIPLGGPILDRKNVLGIVETTWYQAMIRG